MLFLEVFQWRSEGFLSFLCFWVHYLKLSNVSRVTSCPLQSTAVWAQLWLRILHYIRLLRLFTSCIAIFLQVSHSHDMAFIHKWQLFVKYASRGKSAHRVERYQYIFKRFIRDLCDCTLCHLVVRHECFEGINCFSLQGRRVSLEGKLVRLQREGVGYRSDDWVKEQEAVVLEAWWIEGGNKNKIRIKIRKCTVGNILMVHIFWDVPPCRLVSTYRCTQRHIPEVLNLYQHWYDDVISRISITYGQSR
jgi:hypothetical protein